MNNIPLSQLSLPHSEQHTDSDGCLLTVNDVARRLAISKSLVYALIDSGKLASHRIGNGRGCVRISDQDLQGYLTQCRQEQKDEKPQSKRVSRPRLKHIQL